jgi:5'(3')-deoxyribonucleotidase
MRINVDMDGVLFDFDRRISLMVGREPINPTEWAMADRYDLADWSTTFSTFINNFNLFNPGACRLIDPGATDAPIVIARWVRHGFKIRIVSNKQIANRFVSSKAQQQSIEWLSYIVDLKKVDVVFTDDKCDYPADVVIDDNPAIKDWWQPDALNLLYSQPWNRATRNQYPSDSTLLRVADWAEIREEVEILTGVKKQRKVS